MAVDLTDTLYLHLESAFVALDGAQVEMHCPTCREHTADAWLPIEFGSAGGGGQPRLTEQRGQTVTHYTAQHMRCANPECARVVIRIMRRVQAQTDEGAIVESDEHWIAIPRFGAERPVDPLVPERMRRDYKEAAAILDASERMSAVLSRRILSDLLTQAKHPARTLDAQIKSFTADASHPTRLKDNLHYLREMGNISAHTETDEATGEVIDVSREEAEWTLDVVDDLFDYLIVAPERDKARRAEMDEKLKRAGREPIIPPSSDA